MPIRLEKQTICRVRIPLELQSPVATSQHQSLLLKSSKTTCTQTIRLWKDTTTMSHYRLLSVSVEPIPHIRFLQWFQRVRPTALSCPHVNDNALCCRHWFTSSNSLLKHINGTCFAFVPQQPIHSASRLIAEGLQQDMQLVTHSPNFDIKIGHHPPNLIRFELKIQNNSPLQAIHGLWCLE